LEKDSMFAAWGRFVFQRKWWVLAASVLLLAGVASVGFSLKGQLNNTSHVHFESQRASDLLTSQFPKTTGGGGSSFEVLFKSSTLQVSDPAYRAAVETTLQPLLADSRIKDVQTVYSLPAAQAAAVTSRDGKETVAFVDVKDSRNTARTYFTEIRDKIQPAGGLQAYVTGGLAISSDFDTYLADDLQRAELASIPLSVIFLLLVFGTLVAALLPVGVGGAAVVAGVAGTLFLARFTDVSTYAINIVTLVGLGVAIDYSLLIVNRFREELLAGAGIEAAIERSMATAGRAVTFSGLTVAIGLAGMLFYPGTFLVSMGVAGSIVVAMAVIFALTLLPSLLTLTGGAVNRARIPWFGNLGGGGFWKSMAGWVMKRPLLVLLPTLALILLAASPFAQIKIANGDEHMLPPQAVSLQGADLLAKDFPGQDQNTFTVIAYYRDGLSLNKDRVDQLYDYGQQLLSKPNVIRIDSPVTFSPDLGKAQYEALLARLPRRPGRCGEPARRRTGAAEAVAGQGHRGLLRPHQPADPERRGDHHPEVDPRRLGAARRGGAGHRGHRLQPGLHQPDPPGIASGDHLRDCGDLRRPLPARRLGGAAAQGSADQPALHLRLLRRPRLRVPAGPPERSSQLHPPGDRPDRPGDHVLHRLRPLDGLRGDAPDPDPGGLPEDRRQRRGRRRGPGEERADHQRRGCDHDRRLPRLRPRPGPPHQGDRDRARHGGPDRCDADEDADRAVGDEAARQPQLVGAPSAGTTPWLAEARRRGCRFPAAGRGRPTRAAGPVKIRPATEADLGTIEELIRALAAYERMADEAGDGRAAAQEKPVRRPALRGGPDRRGGR